jgi:serine/threonine-protein kinase
MMEGSFLDLEVESGYKGPAGRASSSGSRRGVGSGIDRGKVAGTRKQTADNRSKGIDPVLLGTVVTSLFVAALALGYFLAKVTS